MAEVDVTVEVARVDVTATPTAVQVSAQTSSVEVAATPAAVVVQPQQPASVTITNGSLPGPRGPESLFIQPDPPVTDLDTYLWVETGLGAGGDGFTFWIEDGA